MRSTESALAIPSLGRAFTLLWRAIRLRCPHCGHGRVLAGWASVRERCDHCGLRFHRGDPEYFSGAMFANLIVSEGFFVISFAAALFLTWPNVPWDALTYVGVAVMALLPVVMYPVSKVVWLAMDTLVRPVTDDELLPSAGPTVAPHPRP
jgi:uncharacterized protein (DUF983 family)